VAWRCVLAAAAEHAPVVWRKASDVFGECAGRLRSEDDEFFEDDDATNAASLGGAPPEGLQLDEEAAAAAGQVNARVGARELTRRVRAVDVNRFALLASAPRESMQPLLTHLMFHGRLSVHALAAASVVGALARAVSAPLCIHVSQTRGRRAVLAAGALGMLLAFTLLFVHLRLHTILLAMALHGLAASGPRAVGATVHAALVRGTRPEVAAGLRDEFHVATTAGVLLGLLAVGAATGVLGVMAGSVSQMALAAAALYWGVVKLPATGTTAPDEAQPVQSARELWEHYAAAATRPVRWCLVAAAGPATLLYGMLLQGLPTVCYEHCPDWLQAHWMAAIVAACVLAPLLATPAAARLAHEHGHEAVVLLSCGLSLLTAMVFGAATSGFTLAACVVVAAACSGVNVAAVNEILNDVASEASHPTVLALCVLVLELARAAGVVFVQYGVVLFGMWPTFYLQAVAMLVHTLYVVWSAGADVHATAKAADPERKAALSPLSNVFAARW
jgi:MFS family permease